MLLICKAKAKHFKGSLVNAFPAVSPLPPVLFRRSVYSCGLRRRRWPANARWNIWTDFGHVFSAEQRLQSRNNSFEFH